MENNVTRKVIKREYFLLGIRRITCKKEGPHKGEQMAIVDLQEEVLFDDGTTSYSIQNTFVSVDVANTIMEKNIARRSKVDLVLEQSGNLNSRPKLVGINAI